MVDFEGMFDQRSRDRCLALHGFDPEESHRELLLDVRVGGPAFQRLCRDILGVTWEADRSVHPQHKRVLALACHGLGNPETAAILDIGLETVKQYWKHILPRLGARNRTHAVALYLASEAVA